MPLGSDEKRKGQSHWGKLSRSRMRSGERDGTGNHSTEEEREMYAKKNEREFGHE